MKVRRPRGRVLATDIGRPPQPVEDADDMGTLIQHVAQDPAFRSITDAALLAHSMGFKLSDQETIQKIIAYGRAQYAAELEANRVRQEVIQREVMNHVKVDRSGSHEPIVYYMRLGDLVKIGTSTNLRSRRNTINPQEVMAVEKGGRDHEQGRHQEFKELRVHGEWFRLEEPLVSHIAKLAQEAENDCS